MNKTMVFFDCWDTLIRFQEKDERWTREFYSLGIDK